VSDSAAAKKSRNAPHLRRRNSTGTIFLSHTMSNQDNNATIECVCVVIRAHMLGTSSICLLLLLLYWCVGAVYGMLNEWMLKRDD
jgi:hypothetical protein